MKIVLDLCKIEHLGWRAAFREKRGGEMRGRETAEVD